tara:strand:+ start:541 stop:939 length:399 start_codon:yes stop_codon:yes gene_type:complete
MNMENELVEYLEMRVESRNEWIRDEYGIRYYFDADNCFEEWLEDIPEELWEKHGLDEPDDILETSDADAITDLFLHLKEWCREYFSGKKIKKGIDARRKEDARDARTQAMEMGFHDYHDGSYYPSEGGYSYY